MGGYLPKPVVSQLIERGGNNYVRAGVASVNGFRENMEDGHSIDLHEDYSFFGVFDGHVDGKCSVYFSEHLPKEILKNKPPLSVETVQDICLRLDKEFITENKQSGSTGTFFVCIPKDGEFHLQVGNVGDSRVIVARNGKAIPMTEDHKPELPEEKERIIKCGGFVSNDRVDGNLAVSRAFGDAEYKQSPEQRQNKVIALPDVRDIVCTKDDYAVLCCDGVFESNFSNQEVVEFIDAQMKTTNDLATIAGRVCLEAIDRGSRDNITCMIVRFQPIAKEDSPATEYIPGPFTAPKHKQFRTAYLAMIEKANISYGAGLALRYSEVNRLMKTTPKNSQEYRSLDDECKAFESIIPGISATMAQDALESCCDKWAKERVKDDDKGDREGGGLRVPIEHIAAMLQGRVLGDENP